MSYLFQTPMDMFDRMRILIITAVIVVLDQVTKLAIKARFFLGESLDLLGDYLRFTYIENPGMAFGIRIGGKYFFTIFASVATLIILYYLYRIRHERFASRLALAFILGGAVGNLIDRYAYGQVIDFIDAGLGDMRWPIFNVADSAVTVGMIMLIAFVLFERETPPEKNKTPVFVASEPAPSDEHDKWREARKP